MPRKAAASDDTVEVTLSQHWKHEGTDYKPEERVRVPKETARSLAAAGYLKVDSEDAAAVADVVGE